MAKATTYANDVLDQTLPNAASGTDVIGATTYTLPFRILFLSTLSTAGSQGTEWSTSGGYTSSSGGGAVGGVALNGNMATAASAASKANTTAITITNAPAQTWADNEIHDSTATTQKRVVFKGTPSLAKTVNSGDTCTIAIGSLTGTEV
jgi:hypothetical protein